MLEKKTVVLLALSLKHLAACTCPTKPHTPPLPESESRTTVATSWPNDRYDNICSVYNSNWRLVCQVVHRLCLVLPLT
ncbi:uncharacterized protein PgNI_11714 [Pyricularia grisea]|uniref:Secreted protein n=1 Tax=Pyricularia grisea TaxID=148305 RepID=A0A6P8ANE9_PYRGI|nr:uncharacterized protein PgNI_11714 [Pyricularia grisea]TLD03559.1 hypothetical protein PgNI_11714 [Pyricularia grisea]